MLIFNPTRPEIGKISKNILDRINRQIKSTYKLDLSINTTDMTKWFSNINNNYRSFLQFDIENYYYCGDWICKAFLWYFWGRDWNHQKVQKAVVNKKGQFDMLRGFLNSVEMTDLLSLYILYNLTRTIEVENIGLYWDDELLIIKDSNGPKCKRMNKIILNEFQKIKLKVDIVSNKQIVNFWDVTLDLRKGCYEPYKKNANPIC